MHKVFIGAVVAIVVGAVLWFFSVGVNKEPELVTEVPDFASIQDVKQKKVAFFSYLLPVIDSKNEEIRQQRQQLLAVADNPSSLNPDVMDALREQYRIDQALDVETAYRELLIKVQPVAAELVLIQAANESGWGGSRFAQNGFNFFGIWCFERGCGFVPRARNDGAVHEVRRFDHLNQAVGEYLRTINSHPAYAELRAIRQAVTEQQQQASAIALAEGLSRYSERGQAYIDELQSMLRTNLKYIEQARVQLQTAQDA